MPDAFYFGLFVTAAIIFGGHWIPWPTRPDPDHPNRPSELPRLLAYSYGVGAILAGLWVWLRYTGRFELWLHVCAFAGIAGLTTLATYAYDEWRKSVARHSTIQKLINERREQ